MTIQYEGWLKPYLPRILKMLDQGMTPYQIDAQLNVRSPWGCPAQPMITYIRRVYFNGGKSVREQELYDYKTRRQQIADDFASGLRKCDLADKYNLSPVRISQILKHHERHKAQEQIVRTTIDYTKGINTLKISELDVSLRTVNCFRNDNIYTVGHARQLTDAQLLRIPNFGRKSLREWKEYLVFLIEEYDTPEKQWKRTLQLASSWDDDQYWWDTNRRDDVG